MTTKSFLLISILSVFLLSARLSHAEDISLTSPAIVITVTPAISPDYIDNLGNDPSSSYTTWQQDAIAALGLGLGSYGTQGTPGYYSAQNSTAGGMQAVANSADPGVSSFPSWMGQVVTDPASNYINETGNSVRYGVVIKATGGATFTLAELGFDYTDQSGDLEGTIPAGSYDQTGTSADFAGFLGFDGNTQVTDPNAPLTLLIGAGSGFSSNTAICIPGDPTYPCTPAGEQAALNATSSIVGIPYDNVTGTYFLVDPVTGDTIATGGSTFSITPEPSTWFLMIAAVPVIFGAIRRRRQAA